MFADSLSFIFILFILSQYLSPDSQESNGGANTKGKQLPRTSSGDVKIFQAGDSAVKCLSQRHNKMARVGFEPRPCRPQSQDFIHMNKLTTIEWLWVDVNLYKPQSMRF